MNDIMKIAQAFEDVNILLKEVTKTIQNDAKEQKERFLSMLLGTLGVTFLGRKFINTKKNCKSWLWKKEITFSRKKLLKKIKDGAYVINLDEYADVCTHWITLFYNRNEIVYFDSFGVEHIPEEIK